MTPIYALYVTHERKAAEELAEAGFEAWAPTYLKLRTARPRSRQLAQMIEAPLFPGYVFARIAPGRFHAAKACERVIGVVSICGEPWPVPELAFADVIVAVMAGRFNERMPHTRARPRGERRRGMAALSEWFEAVGRTMKRAA